MSLNIEQYTMCITKANKYVDTEKVGTSVTTCDDYLHYEIDEGAMLSLSHLLAIILYTDWTKLSFKFTKSFRRVNFYESIELIKKCNEQYAIWIRLLREVVEYWGSIEGSKNELGGVEGPFVCGMNHVMILPEYDIRLCGPTST